MHHFRLPLCVKQSDLCHLCIRSIIDAIAAQPVYFLFMLLNSVAMFLQ